MNTIVSSVLNFFEKLLCWIKPKRNVGLSTLRSYFTNDVADSDGLFHGLVIPKKQANYLFALSWVSLASGIYAIYVVTTTFLLFH